MAAMTVPCPFCQGRTQVMTALWDDYFKTIRRWRFCPDCDYRWATIEIDHDQAHLLTGAPERPQDRRKALDDPEHL
jgi:transcriptional regulator NrdR family protein